MTAQANLSLIFCVKKVAVLHADGLLAVLADSVMGFAAYGPTLIALACGLSITPAIEKRCSFDADRIDRASIAADMLFVNLIQYPILSSTRIVRHMARFLSP